jgi:uncharacterized protein (TIGR03435 family)
MSRKTGWWVGFIALLANLWAGHNAVAQGDAKFEAAALKTAPTGARFYPRLDVTPGRLTARAATLRYLISEAYGVEDYQLAGLSGWMESDLYMIVAGYAGTADPDRLKTMLRSLLEDRFQLKVRQEPRTMPVFALMESKGGTKLQTFRDGEPDGPPPDPTGQHIFMRYSTIQELVKRLNQFTGQSRLSRPIVDRTGLQGKYRIWLGFEAHPNPDSNGGTWEADLPALLPEQLGLRLEPVVAQVQFIVLEKAARPALE